MFNFHFFHLRNTLLLRVSVDCRQYFRSTGAAYLSNLHFSFIEFRNDLLTKCSIKYPRLRRVIWRKNSDTCFFENSIDNRKRLSRRGEECKERFYKETKKVVFVSVVYGISRRKVY